MRKKSVFLDSLWLVLFWALLAPTAYPVANSVGPATSVTIYRTAERPVIDGRLDDAVWQQATRFGDFFTFKPDFGKPTSETTGVYVAYDHSGYTQFLKQLYLEGGYRRSDRIYYDDEAPFQGKGNTADLYLQYQPFDKLNGSLGLSYYDFYRSSDNEKIIGYTIWRSRTTFQVNRCLFFRGIVEYNHYWKTIDADFLASFTYIPGTVVHLGYGSTYERIQWGSEDREYFPADDYRQTRKSFFFKASYLWRF